MSKQVKVQEAAPPLPRLRDRRQVAEMLRAAAGRWHLLGQHATSSGARQVAVLIKRGGRGGWAEFGPGFEAEARTMLGEHRVYARYTGGVS